MDIMTGVEYIGYIDIWTGEACLSGEEIVRCRDCKFWTADPDPIDPGWPMWCERFEIDMVAPDNFCSWAEKKVDTTI